MSAAPHHRYNTSRTLHLGFEARRWRCLLLGWLCLSPLLLAACHRTDGISAHPSGLLLGRDLDEISGLAASGIHPGVLWAHNDGGNAPMLYAIDRRGRTLTRYRLEGVDNTDWEDIARFALDGRRYLLIADTGDNGGLRDRLRLHVFEEPEHLRGGHLKLAWSIAFIWPDGARDCEAVAVDAAANQALLVTKKRQPPQLFAVPLRPGSSQPATARLLGRLTGVPQANARLRRISPFRARLYSQITAADLSADRRRLALITYDNLLIYDRQANEDWGRAMARAPSVYRLPWLPQPEALTWAIDGRHLYLAGEVAPSPIYALSPPLRSIE